MLPQDHFLIAGIVITPVAIMTGDHSLLDIGKWIVVGGAASVAIDIDVAVTIQLKSNKFKILKKYKKPKNVFKDLRGLINALFKTGLIKTTIVSHLIISTLFILLSYLYWNNFFIPISIGVISHLLSDIPNIRFFK